MTLTVTMSCAFAARCSNKGNDFCRKITYRTGFVRDIEKKGFK